MTPRVREHGPDKRAQGVWGVQDLRERPGVMPANVYPGDRAVEYLWGGPKLNWTCNPPGFSILADFDQWERDLTIDWGGYFHNGGGSDNSEFYIGAPLGPRYSSWHLDWCVWEGPDAGAVEIHVCTTPIYRHPLGIVSPADHPQNPAVGGGSYSGLTNFDIPNPILSSYFGPWQAPGEFPDGFDPDNDSDLWHPWYTWGFYQPAMFEGFNNYYQEVGTTFRLMGEYGQLLTNTDMGASQADEDAPPASTPHTGVSFDSGDGVMYWFRFRMDESIRDAASTGNKAKIQAVRLSRAIEDDGTII